MIFFRVIILELLLLVTFAASGQKKDVTIRIVQEETVITAGTEQHSITLEKKSFKIQVLLQNIKGVYAFASMSDSLYRLADNAPVPGFADLPEMTMAEEQYNKEKELIINNEGWAYWFYNPQLPWHRFNKKLILLDSGRVVGSKSVRQLYLLPKRHTVKLKDNYQPLYLFFVAVEEDTDGKPLKELLRRKIKIEWRDED